MSASKKQRLYKEARDYHGATLYHDRGFKGEGITFLALETSNTHLDDVLNAFTNIAPKAKTLAASIMYSATNDRVTDLYLQTKDGKRHELEEYVSENKVDVISQSWLMNGSPYPSGVIKRMRDLNCIIMGAAGNGGELDNHGVKTPLREIAYVVGAVELVNGKPKRASYSSYGRTSQYTVDKDNKRVDFTFLPGPYSGTSFSSPALAGLVALILERYGPMTQDEMYDILKDSCDQEEYSIETGWGSPRLQNVDIKEKETEDSKMEIRCKIGSNIVKVDGKATTLSFPLFEIGGTSVLPTRILSEAFGAKVDYDSKTKEIIIKK